MEVTGVKAFPVSLKMTEPYYVDAFGGAPTLEMVIVLVDTDENIYGVGETWPGHTRLVGGTVGGYLDLINNHICPLIKGIDPHDINKIHSMLEERLRGLEIYRGTFNIAVNMCISAVDIALYDIVGKDKGVAAVDLIGGRVRDKLPLMPCHGILSPAELVETHRKTFAKEPWKGCKAIKVKIAGPNYDLKLDVETIKVFREAVGPDVTIVPDANGAWTVSDAINVIHKLERYDPIMVEQPVARDDIEGLVKVAKAVDAPLVADGSVYTPELVFKVAQTGFVEHFNLKPMRSGGIHGTMKSVHVIEAAGFKCCIDAAMDSMIFTTADAHVAAAISDRTLEYFSAATMIPWFKDPMVLLKKGGIELKKGAYAVLPDMSGLGLELKDGILKKIREYEFPRFPVQPTT